MIGSSPSLCPPSSRAPLEEVVPGERLQTAEGTCYLVRREYPVSHHYGGRPLESARAVAGTTLAALARDDGLASLSFDQACFLDTETTGLAGGTGTHVFMVGVGYFAGDSFRVDQYFMEDYDREPGLISALEQGLHRFAAVVSFNGKGFDLPLLETRFVLSRRRPALSGRPHLDLLFPARRLWGLRLESCRLVALEEAILGETRIGDVPGYLVPDHYFRFLRTGDPWAIRPVFEHNRQDVLSLLALAGRAAERFETFLVPPEDVPAGVERAGAEPLDLYGLARLYLALGLREAAARCLVACLEGSPPAYLAPRAGVECVRLLRRLGRTDEAVRLCERMADGYPRHLWALVELAKQFEHRVKDFDRALAVVDRALGLAAAGEGRPSGRSSPDDEAIDGLAHRRERLLRKKARRPSSRIAGLSGPRVIPPPPRE